MMGSEAKMEEQALLSDADRAAEVASLKAAEAANLATAKALYEQQKMEGDEKEARGRAESAELLDPFALGTVAMLVGAFVDNVCSALYDVPLKYYLYDDLGVSVRAYYVLSACTSIPSSLLPFFGLLALVPIRGCHHKFYWMLGYALSCACYLVLGTSSGSPSFSAIVWWLTCAAVGSSLRSTMLAMMMVERTRHETLANRGLFSLYLASARAGQESEIPNFKASYLGRVGVVLRRAFVGQALASVLYENELGLGSWGGFTISQIFVICGVAPLVVVIPLACFLKEVPSIAARSTKSVAARARFEFVAIWETLQDKRIGCILSFGLALYLLTVTNAAHSYLLLDGCDISEPEYCWLKIVQDMTLWGVIVFYRQYLFEIDLHTLFVGAYVVRTLAKLNDCVAVVLTLALLLALAKRSARDASERSASMSYLAIASILNVASSISDIIDIYLEDIWDVNTDKLEAHDYGGYWRLELLTALVPLAVLGFLPLLPRTREAAATKEDGWFAPWKDAGHGRTAAFLFVAFWVLGDVYVFVYSIETA
ncbi:PGAP1-like protein [Aureococcus anophagefferens]|nr:PGAP1-like protein [Aureococcus anophagefferens]